MVDRRFNEEAMRRKVARQQAEREAKELAERIRQQIEADKRKPHCSGEMSDLERKILQRLDRIAKARAEIQSGKAVASSRPSARQRWEQAVESCVTACGGNRMRAVAMANQQHPGLRQQMLNEVNAGRR